MKTSELITEWKKEDLITEYGEFRFTEIYEKYGEEKAGKLISRISYEDIWESMSYKQLRKVAFCMLNDMMIDLQKNRVFVDDAEAFHTVMIILLGKYESCIL